MVAAGVGQLGFLTTMTTLSRPKHTCAGKRLLSILAAEKGLDAAENSEQECTLPARSAREAKGSTNSNASPSSTYCCEGGDNGELQISCSFCGHCAHVSCLGIDVEETSEHICVDCAASQASQPSQKAPNPQTSRGLVASPGGAIPNVSTGESNQACYMCAKAIGGDSVVVTCCDSKCDVVAHADCAGYTARGASRAKFLCTIHKGSKPVQSSKSKAKSERRGTVSPTAPEPEPPHKHSPACCDCEGSVHVSPDSLYQELSAAIKEIEASNRQEKKELRMLILQLESKVQSLEDEIRVLRKTHTRGSRQQLASSQPKVHVVKKGQSYAEVVNQHPHGGGKGKPVKGKAGYSALAPASASGRNTLVFYNKPSTSNGGSFRFSSRIERGGGDSAPLKYQPGTHDAGSGSPNYCIVWGTRFSTREDDVLRSLALLVPSEDPSSISVKRSVRRSPSNTKWWFTVCAPVDILNTLDDSWGLLERTVP